MLNQENESLTLKPYYTVERVTEIISNLKSKYPSEAEDTSDVCALIEFRKILKLLRVHN
jgi:hypothetical protein